MRPEASAPAIRGEQAEPQVGPDRHDDADGGGDAARHQGADPGQPLGAGILPGADVGADQGGERRADAEADRHQHVFQPAADAVAGDGGIARAADQAGDEQHRAVGQDDDQAGDQADLQDVAERGASGNRPSASAAGIGAFGPISRDSIQSAARVKEITAAAAGPRMPSFGRPNQPRVERAGERDLQRRGERPAHSRGVFMSPVPRSTEAMVLAIQCAPQPRNRTVAKATAPSSARPLPPSAP